MTAPRTRGLRRLLVAVRCGGALTVALAIAGLLAVGGASSPARAASANPGYNQITGIGETASAITVPWTAGLLNNQNQPITGASSTDGTPELSPNADRAAASPTSPLSFMYSDFKNLKVTVSQTQNVTHQGITVSWSGMAPTSVNGPNENFLQLMECYGDSASGPSPEGCEFGSPQMLGASQNIIIGDRGGYICGAGTVPSTNPTLTPVGALGFGDPSTGCDTDEPAAETVPHCVPGATGDQACSAGKFYVPFVPVNDPTTPLYTQGTLAQAFDRFSTNEVQEATTSANGTGQQQFETLTANQAPGLGCGQLESNGQPRDCWLVIVPRGQYEPNGFNVSPTASGLYADGKYLDTSPLSASNWAQRIQIHLNYAPLASSCPPDVVPDGMVGTQVMFRAVTSWQQELNQAAKCSRVYSYTASTEGEATAELATAGSGGGAGLAFTTIPIGSEAAANGVAPTKLPKILYAPVAVTALGLGFNIDEGGVGQDSTPVKLTPQLLANALTQVYQHDLPDWPSSTGAASTWAKKNPTNLTDDPAFQKLNPTSVIPVFSPTYSIAPLIVGDHSADDQRVWEYVQSDSATAAWLDGKAAPSNPVTADPDYASLNLGKTPALNSFPVAYTGRLKCDQNPENSCGSDGSTTLDSIDMLPTQTNFDSAAANVLAGSDAGLTTGFAQFLTSPSNTPGWWSQVGVEVAGSRFMWTVNDMPDLAAYGLISAELCDPSGTDCIQPSVASLSAALASATKDSAGLLQVNPAKVKAGAYPLVDVVYAAVPTDQAAAALKAYADFIAYAAGKGQTVGSAPGDLSPGYLPLTASLQSQAQAVVRQLRAIASPTGGKSSAPTHSPTPAHSSTGGNSQQGQTTPETQPGTQPQPGSEVCATPTATPAATHSPAATPTPTTTRSPTATPTATATPTPTAPACASSSSSPQGVVILPPASQAASGTTPGNSVGAVREALVVVLIIGAAGAIGGAALSFGRVPSLRRVPRLKLLRRRTR